MTEKNLYQRLLAIQSEIDGIEKAGTNESQGYKFLRAVDVTKVVRTLLVKHGVYVATGLRQMQHPQVIDRPNKSAFILATVDGTMTFVNVDVPTETLVIDITGSGGAFGEDKGAYKAITGAIKYGLRAAFLIPDEADDPEVTVTDTVVVPPPPIFIPTVVNHTTNLASDKQKAMVRAEARKQGLEGENLRAFMLLTTGKQSSKQLEIGDIDILLMKLGDAELVNDFATATIGEEVSL